MTVHIPALSSIMEKETAVTKLVPLLKWDIGVNFHILENS